MFQKAVIIPTGDELIAGMILDTDSPAVMSELLGLNTNSVITRLAPVRDREDAIIGRIRECAGEGYDLIVMIGGSGGGHRYSPTLGKDFTHSSLEEILSEKHSCELYGKNGHLWSKLIIGRLEQALVLNLPGPYEEAKAAIRAFCETYAEDGDDPDLEKINKAMAEALRKTYGA